MKKALKILLYVFLSGLTSLNLKAQSCNCIHLDSSQKKLYLNGDNFTLIDNALRCFKLSSIAKEKDSIVRIWILENDYPDTPITSRVKMFEFGKKGSVPFATLYILEWGYKNDSSLPVKCIKQINIPPNQGWFAFEKDIRRLDLPAFYKKPFPNPHNVIVDFGMLTVQFLFGNNTYTVDFTGLVDVSDSVSAMQSNYSKRILYLLYYIQKHFSVNLSAKSNGDDFFKEGKLQLNLLRK